MLGLDNYGSDSDSDHEANGQQPPRLAPAKSTLLSSLPPPSRASHGSADAATAHPASLSAKNLPAPKATNKRRGGPVKIKVEGLKPTETSDDEDEPRAKKPRLQTNGAKTAGAGSSALLAMLPAPKKSSTLALPPPKMLGSGAGGGNDTGVVADDPGPAQTAGSESQDSADLEFLPAFLRKPRNAPPPSIGKAGTSAPIIATPPPPPPAPAQTEEVDFFSLGEPHLVPEPSFTQNLPTETSIQASSGSRSRITPGVLWVIGPSRYRRAVLRTCRQGVPTARSYAIRSLPWLLRTPIGRMARIRPGVLQVALGQVAGGIQHRLEH